MSSNISGEATRQAVECLGGYAYQIFASALARATLSEGEVLHLAVAEDFAVSTKSALKAVQIKRTEAKVTSNSTGIVAAINSFVTLSLSEIRRIANDDQVAWFESGFGSVKIGLGEHAGGN
jgi:hypothetical protein